MSIVCAQSVVAALASSVSIATFCCVMQLQWVPSPGGGAPCTYGSNGQI